VRRYNQNRRISLEADLNNAQLGDAMTKIRALPIFKNLPTGMQIVEIGQAQYMQELFTSFCWRWSPASCWYSRAGAAVRATVPANHDPLGTAALDRRRGAGAVGHAQPVLTFDGARHPDADGIVAKNSILLVEFAIEEMRAGKDRLTALLEAGHKRARPIVMTSVAMIAGMTPVALGMAGNAEFQSRWRSR